MFRSADAASRRSPLLGALKTAAPALAFAAGLAAASAGHATAYYLNSATMDTGHIASINGPAVNVYAYDAPVTFTVNVGTAPGAPTFDLTAFCVDIYHDMYLGHLGYKYDDTDPLSTDSYNGFTGNVLSDPQLTQLLRLINYGSNVVHFTPHDTDKLAGVQAAIWQVVAGSNYTVAAYNNATVQTYINNYSGSNYQAFIADLGRTDRKVLFIKETGSYGTNLAHQSFAFTAVPEPATWGLLIAGFGLTGAVLRRRRAAVATVRI